MTSEMQRRDRGPGTMSPFARLDRMFDEWMRALPNRRAGQLPWDFRGEEVISVDEFRDGDTQVVRAELAGIDPERDVQITVTDGVLRIDAERRVEKETEDKGYTRHELRYGSFTRTLPIPEGATEQDITATYKDGILEIRVPVPAPAEAKEPTRIAVTKA